MGTLTITAAAFTNLPASAPPNWPENVTWPGGGSANGSKTYTISDTDWISILTWTASSQTSIQGTATTPSTPTPGQILLAWLGIWISGTRQAVQQYFTTQPVPPTPINVA